MSVVIVGDLVTREQLLAAAEDYGGLYVKVVVDVETGAMAIGGEWHADGERELLKLRSKQADLWGGGVDLKTMEINYSAMTNIKPGVNAGHVIVDAGVRAKFDRIVRGKMGYE